MSESTYRAYLIRRSHHVVGFGVRTLDNLGPQNGCGADLKMSRCTENKCGVRTLNVDLNDFFFGKIKELKISCNKNHETFLNHVFFQLAPFLNPDCSGECCHFLGTRKFASSILRGGKRCQAKKDRCIKVRKTGVARTLKYQGPQKTGVVCGP